MKKHLIKLTGFVIVALFCWSCGGSSENTNEYSNEEKSNEEEMVDDEIENPQQAMQQAMKEIEKAVEETGMGKVEPVDFRTLKDLLPESVAGIDRTNSEGEKSGAMGIKISKAEARYDADGKRIDITITDMGSMSAGGMGGMFAAGWLMAEIDRESDKEYEKTTTYNGHKAFEKYNYDRKRGEISVMVAGRFLVNVEGDDVSMDDIKEALEEIDLDDLEDMKDEGKE